MRGILAFGVVLLHLGFNSFAQRTLGWNGIAFDLCVDVFFLLSGFVLTYSMQRKVAFGEFVIKRFLRLAPVFCVTTLAVVVLAGKPASWLELFMAEPFVGNDPVNFPAWSVCWEFYLPIIALLAPFRIPDQAVPWMLAAALFGLGLADIAVSQGGMYYFIRALLGLGAGHLLFRIRRPLALPLTPLVVALVALMALAKTYAVFAIAVPAVAAVTILAGQTARSLLRLAPFQWLGTISYTLYLVHIPVLFISQSLFPGRVDSNPSVKLVLLVVSLASAWILTVAIERPAMRLSRRLTSQFGQPPPVLRDAPAE